MYLDIGVASRYGGVHQNRSFQRIGDTYVPMRRSPKKFVFITYRKEHIL